MFCPTPAGGSRSRTSLSQIPCHGEGSACLFALVRRGCARDADSRFMAGLGTGKRQRRAPWTREVDEPVSRVRPKECASRRRRPVTSVGIATCGLGQYVLPWVPQRRTRRAKKGRERKTSASPCLFGWMRSRGPDPGSGKVRLSRPTAISRLEPLLPDKFMASLRPSRIASCRERRVRFVHSPADGSKHAKCHAGTRTAPLPCPASPEGGDTLCADRGGHLELCTSIARWPRSLVWCCGRAESSVGGRVMGLSFPPVRSDMPPTTRGCVRWGYTRQALRAYVDRRERPCISLLAGGVCLPCCQVSRLPVGGGRCFLRCAHRQTSPNLRSPLGTDASVGRWGPCRYKTRGYSP